MKPIPAPLDLTRVKVFPLAQRHSESEIEAILINPQTAPPPCSTVVRTQIDACVTALRAARQRDASVMLIYGAHLIKNGGGSVMNEMIKSGWITHLATNGAGTIHDWEFAHLGLSTESVQKNVATGTFGTWDETGRNIHLALLAGGLRDEGYGRSLGRFIMEDGTRLPQIGDLERQIRDEPSHPLTPARAELLQAMQIHKLRPGVHEVKHPWRNTSVLATAFAQNVPLTVHPGIGYDIISNHPMFNGAAIGRAATMDFRLFGSAVARLDGGVVLSIGSAIMGPQVFEKSISCVNNLRLQEGKSVVRNHTIFVVDLQDGGNWDWTQGEPPRDNAAYYLRFCKSYSRMGGAMHYVQSDNVAFLHNLQHSLR